MFSYADQLLLARPTPDHDHEIAFRRIDGNAASNVIYFLPWHTTYRMARSMGILPLDYLACYEVPPALVSSVPQMCVAAVNGVARDAVDRVRSLGRAGAAITVAGFSIGAFPASVVAGALGARLIAVASGDRGPQMIWESPAAAAVKARAVAKGFTRADFEAALVGLSPTDQLERIAPDSLFVLGNRDPFVPTVRHRALIGAIFDARRRHRIIELPCGHLATIVRSRMYQLAYAAELMHPRVYDQGARSSAMSLAYPAALER